MAASPRLPYSNNNLYINLTGGAGVKTVDSFNSKPIYTKVLGYARGSITDTTDATIPHGVSGYSQIWIDQQNSFMHKSTLSAPLDGAYINGGNLIIGFAGNRNGYNCYVTIRYTLS